MPLYLVYFLLKSKSPQHYCCGLKIRGRRDLVSDHCRFIVDSLPRRGSVAILLKTPLAPARSHSPRLRSHPLPLTPEPALRSNPSSRKNKKEVLLDFLFISRKERFELSRRLSRPTPLAGAPLRPLEYFRRRQSQTVSDVIAIILYYICPILSIGIFNFSIKVFRKKLFP